MAKKRRITIGELNRDAITELTEDEIQRIGGGYLAFRSAGGTQADRNSGDDIYQQAKAIVRAEL